MTAYLRLLRISQWLKNSFIFAAAFFGGVFFSPDHGVAVLTAGFFCFCAVSSAIYILNDIRDVENDRIHPEKRKRPLASGEAAVPVALVMMGVLAAAGLCGAFFINRNFLYILLTYTGINIAYSFGLKKVALLDIIMVSSGFILRVMAGGVISDVEVSHWLFIMTFLLALFLAIAKRRDDLVLLENTGTEMRKSIKGYNMDFVNVAMGMMAAVIVVSYILYITSPEITKRFNEGHLYISSFFVITGLLRYLQITMVEKKSGSPTRILLSDVFLQVVLLMWIGFFAFEIYFHKNGF